MRRPQRRCYACDFWGLDLTGEFEDFETATDRANESFSTVSSVHTSYLKEFSSETKDDIQGGGFIMAMLGFDDASASDKNWLKNLSEKVGILVRTDNFDCTCEMFWYLFALDFSVTEMNYISS